MTKAENSDRLDALRWREMRRRVNSGTDAVFAGLAASIMTRDQLENSESSGVELPLGSHSGDVREGR